MEQRSSVNKIIIVILVVLIAVAGGVLAATVVTDKKESAQTSAVQTTAAQISNDELEGILEQQPMYTDGVKYYYANSSKQLEFDAMGASVFNNSDVNIQKFTIAFCAFDENDEAIKIKQPNEDGDGAYIRTISYDLSTAKGDKKYIEPLESFDNVIFYVTNEPQIVTIKACVKEYTSVDGIVWKNPYYTAFKNNYSGKNLHFAEK